MYNNLRIIKSKIAFRFLRIVYVDGNLYIQKLAESCIFFVVLLFKGGVDLGLFSGLC